MPNNDNALVARSLVVKSVSVPAPILLSDGSVIRVPEFEVPPQRVTEDDVVRLLDEDARFVSLCVVALYDRQMLDERADARTKYDNKIGFNQPDARRGTYYGEWVTGKNVRFPQNVPSVMVNGHRIFLLSGKHLAKAREMLFKYRKQLARALNGER